MSAQGEHGLSRRGFLFGELPRRNAALAASGGLVAAHGIAGGDAQGFTLRPPGALDARDFVATCLRCGQCIAACPFDTLRPADSGAVAPAGTPQFTPRSEACRMCDDVPCARACPSGALRSDVKIREAQMGLAVMVDQEKCLAYQGLRCETCYRACPAQDDAIVIEYVSMGQGENQAYFLPKVRADRCTGCGMCEHACVLERPAIKVLPVELAQAALGGHYRMEGEEREATRDDGSSADDEGTPDDNLDAVLGELQNLRGLEDDR